MSNNNSKKLSSITILIGVSLLALLSVVLHYLGFLSQVLAYPLAASLQESWNTTFAFSLYSPTTTFSNTWNYAISPAFTELLIASIKILGKNFNTENISFIFSTSRVLSLVGLLGSLSIFYLIQKKEDIKPLASLASFLILLSLPLIQEFSFKSAGASLGLMFGFCAIYRFMTYVRKESWRPAILIGSCLALSIALSHNLVFWAFPLSCFVILFSVKNKAAFFKIALVFSLLIALDTFISFRTHGFSGSFLGLTGWKSELWTQNLDIFYSWALFSLIALFLFLVGRKIDFETNPIHPCNTIVLFALPSNLLLSGMSLDNLSGWALLSFAIVWMGAIFLNKLLTGRHRLGLNLLSCLILAIALFTPLLPPELILVLQEKPSALAATQEWLQKNKAENQNQSKVEKRKSKRKKRKIKQQQIFSQDPTLNLIAATSLEEIYDPIKLFNDDSLTDKLETAFLEQKFDKVFKTKFFALPSSIQQSIRTSYLPEQEILVAGSPGAMYIPGIPSDVDRRDPKWKTENEDQVATSEEGYATFTKVE